jgi:Hint module
VPNISVVVGNILSGKVGTAIRSIFRQGVYAPLTQSSDIVVNGIKASNYVNILDDTNVHIGWNQHILGHSYYLPQRMFCSYFLDVCKKEHYFDGYGFWCSILVHVGTFLKQQGYFAVCLVSLISTPIVVLVFVLESINTFELCALSLVVIMTMIKFHHRNPWR